MKKFTVKDFLLYACPCFGCDSPVGVRVGVEYKVPESDNKAFPLYMAGSITPTVSQSHTHIDLKISYENALSLAIDHRTNKFATNDQRLLRSHFVNHNINLVVDCGKCGTNFQTRFLTFNLEKNYVYPVEMSSEFFMIKDGHNSYSCYNDFEKKTSSISVGKLLPPTSAPIDLQIPLLPCYKMKSKQHFIDKIKTYLTFS